MLASPLRTSARETPPQSTSLALCAIHTYVPMSCPIFVIGQGNNSHPTYPVFLVPLPTKRRITFDAGVTKVQRLPNDHVYGIWTDVLLAAFAAPSSDRDLASCTGNLVVTA